MSTSTVKTRKNAGQDRLAGAEHAAEDPPMKLPSAIRLLSSSWILSTTLVVLVEVLRTTRLLQQVLERSSGRAVGQQLRPAATTGGTTTSAERDEHDDQPGEHDGDRERAPEPAPAQRTPPPG